MQKESRLQRITLILLCSALAIYLTRFAFSHIASAVLPFVTAWAVSLSLRRPTELLAKYTGMPKKASGALMLILTALASIYLIFIICSILVREARELYAWTMNSGVSIEDTAHGISESLRSIALKIPYLGKSNSFARACEHLDERLLAFASDSAPKIISLAGSFLGRVARTVPYFAVFLLVTVISAFWFCTDLSKINKGIAGIFPEKIRKILFLVKDELYCVIFGYLRAYSLLILLTFTELFIGLSLVGAKYAFLLSFLIALVDILPVLGAGTVLVPWGAVLLVLGNIRDGTCILVLYLIITVIRQLAEPKIVGGFLGLHPLFTLFAMYVGVKIAGFSGLFLFPIGAIVARNVYEKCKNQGSERCDSCNSAPPR